MDIFRSYDIRGRYPHELNEEIAFKVGLAFGKYIGRKKVVLGMDARASSPSLKKSLVKGLTLTGNKIIDIGLCTTPMTDFGTWALKANYGTMITASHNPSSYNGIKFVKNVNGDVLQIGMNEGLKDIKKIFSEINNTTSNGKKKGKTNRRILKLYVSYLLKKLEKRSGLRIVIDYGNGVGSIPTIPFFMRTKFETTHLFSDPDPNFPNHLPNPSEEKNFRYLKREVKKQGADLGILFDGDADRAIPVDEKGRVVWGDILFGILATEELKKLGGGKIYYDLRATKTLPEEIKRLGGTPIKMRVGNPYYKEKLSREGIMAGEVSGHIMYKENHCIDDGLFAMIKLINILTKTKVGLSELSVPFRKYYRSGEKNFAVSKRKEIISKIEKFYSKLGGKISKLDGITVEFEDWWFNLRPSNTENFLRLIVEAVDKKTMKKKLKEVENLIKKYSHE